MTWDTEESSEVQSATSGGLDSALIWSDDPEKAYFRSMLNDARGNDSLIGDSTLGELLDENTLPTNDGPPGVTNVGSGLTLAEDDTLANIEPEQASIRASWFQRRKEQQQKPAPAPAPVTPIAQPVHMTPPTRAPVGNNPPPELPVIRMHPDEFPSFIFVTNGHSSAVKTKEKPVDPAKRESTEKKQVPPKGAETSNGRARAFYGRIAIVFLLLAVIISMVMLAMILAQKKKRSVSPAESFQNTPTISPGFGFFFPTSAPTLDPTGSPVKPSPTPGPTFLRNGPTTSPVSGPIPTNPPTRGPTPSPTLRPTPRPTRPPAIDVIPTPSPTPLPTAKPTTNPTPSPTEAIPNDVLSEITSLSPLSAPALQDETSPQYQALVWAVSDARQQDNGRMLSSVEVDDALIQRWALATLYFSTNGDNWTTKTSWLTSVSECRWHAVDCNDNGQVDAIALRNNNLAGYIPLELSMLSSRLQFLYLNSNALIGSIPTTFGLLTRLDRISLTLNQISGAVPSELSRLTHLSLLGLGRNQLEGQLPSELGTMPRLKTLDVSRNNLQGTIPSELARLPVIEDLILQDNWMGGQLPPEFGGMTTIKKLMVSTNVLQGTIPPEFGGMVNLESLELQDNAISGRIPPALGKLSNLENFDVSRTSVTGTIPAPVCQLPTARIGADCEEVSCRCCDFCCVDGEDCVDTTRHPTRAPTFPPTFPPVADATPSPTGAPSKSPTPRPTNRPTPSPTPRPTQSPTPSPTRSPVTDDPTKAPTPSPTPEPTKLSTSSPTPCSGEIQTDNDCYGNGATITAFFENCNPQPDDWIGIYPSNVDPMDLGDPLAWVWTCGDRVCDELAQSGEVSFYHARGRGSFRAFLVRRNSGGPYSAYAIGNEFTISNFC